MICIAFHIHMAKHSFLVHELMMLKVYLNR
jgi:hypothetical protein